MCTLHGRALEPNKRQWASSSNWPISGPCNQTTFYSPQESGYGDGEDTQHQCLQSPIAVWYPRCPASAPDISIYIGWRQIWNRLDYHPKKLDQDYHPMERSIKITIQRNRSRRASPTCRLQSRLSSAIHCAHTFESDEPSKQMIRCTFKEKN